MPFDPDAYLASKPAAPAAAGFDPDAYLAKSGKGPEAPPENREQEIRRERLKALVAAGEPGYTARLKDAWTSGLSRPIGGALSVATGEIGELFGGKPATIGERWRGGVGAEEDYAKRAVANTPGVVGRGVDLLGSLASGGRSVGGAVPGLGVQALRAGTQGAIEGAAKNSEDVGSAATGAAIGGTIGAGATGLLGALTDRLGRVVRAKKDLGEASRGGSGQQMRTDAGDIFETLKDAGIRYSAKETAPLAGNVVRRLAQEGFNPNMHHQVLPVLGEIGASGGGMTWSQLRNMQTQISDLKASADPRLRRIAGELSDEVTNFVNTARPTMPAASVAAGINPARDVATAKDLYARGKHSGKLEGMAEVAAGAKDPAEATSSVFKRYSDTFTKNPDKFNPNSPEQRRLIDVIAAGDPKTAAAAKGLESASNSLMRYGAAAAVGGAALPSVFNDSSGIGSGVSAGGAGAVGLGLLGKGGARGLRAMIAEKGAERVNDLLRNVATGQTAQAPGAYVPRNILAMLLAKQDLQRGAGNYGASFVNKE